MAHLKGMIEITEYARRSKETIIKWIEFDGFPARKLSDGVWQSDTGLIDRWYLRQIQPTGGDVLKER